MNWDKTKWKSLCLKWIVMASALLSTPGRGIADVPLAKQRYIVDSLGRQLMVTSKLKSILVSNFTYGYNHTIGIPNMMNTLVRIGASEGWKVDSITDGSLLTASKLKNYQVFFANYISGFASKTPVDAPFKAAVRNFVETQGGGLFIMHATGDSKASANWDWYYQVAHPVLYTSDNPQGKGPAASFIPAKAKNSPVMQGIAFQGKDTVVLNNSELHLFTHIITDVHPKATVFMAVDGNRCGTCLDPIYRTPGGYPISWSFPAGHGTIGYFMEGHDLATMTSMTQPVWDRFFKQFMYTLAGYDTTDNYDPYYPPPDTGVRIKPLDIALDQAGITFHPDGAAAVIISGPGAHGATLMDLRGRVLKAFQGNRFPADYDFTAEMDRAKTGVYLLRVTLGEMVKTKRFVARR